MNKRVSLCLTAIAAQGAQGSRAMEERCRRLVVELPPPPMAGPANAATLHNDLLKTTQAAARLVSFASLCIECYDCRFYNDPNPENTNSLDGSLMSLIRDVSTVDPAARLTLTQPSLVELLNYLPSLLTSHATNASTRSKLLRLLFNIGQHNVPLRRHMAKNMDLCGAGFECLKRSIQEQLGPQNMIDVLRLLQVLTYEKTFDTGIWTNECVSFLLGELSRDQEFEWLPYSIAILCNLATRSTAVARRIKSSTSFKPFVRRLTRLLQHDSRIVVVSSLVLVGFLDEQLRELVYCSQNIAQTFQCVFNVLILGDTLMTRHIAVDLLQRLVVAESPSVSSTPSLSPTGKDLINYSYFSRCLQQTAALLVTLDARTEESTKIYDVLLSFCSLPSMRSTVCAALMDTPTTEQRLTSPLTAIARTARMPFEEAIEPGVPLRALRLINYLLKEAVEGSRRLIDLIPAERLLSIIDSTVKTPIQTGHEQVVAQCSRICEGLRLAEVVSGDDSIRPSLLEVLSAPLCAHLAETQLLSNPVVIHMGKAPQQRTADGVPPWSAEGVNIVLELLGVLASFKDYSKPHKDQYWKSIKDERLLPLLAFAISRGPPSMVHHALVLYTHCAQNHSFPSNVVADLVASCTAENELTSRGEGRPPSRINGAFRRRSNSADKENGAKRAEGREKGGPAPPTMKELDELIAKMRAGLNLAEPRTSDLLAAYENKLKMQLMRERELELLVAAKEAALQQSEKLRIQYATSGARTVDHEALLLPSPPAMTTLQLAQIRTLVEEIEQMKAEKETLQKEAARTAKELEKISTELEESRREKAVLRKDVDGERELTANLRRSMDDYKGKMAHMSKMLLQQQETASALDAKIDAKNDEIYKMTEERKAMERAMEEMKNERDEFKTKLDEMQRKAARSEQEMEEKKRRMREEMMRIAGDF